MVVILAGALIIGLTLGLLGSGGSAVTVPLLVYLVGHAAKQAIAESMAIVGLISVAAAVPYARVGQIDWRSVWYFGIPGMFGAFVGAWLGGHAPEAVQLAVFGCVLITAAYVMLRHPTSAVDVETVSGTPTQRRSPARKVALEGALVGVVTGFVGVGGGFLIVPALVVFDKLPMRLAIGSSLVIIAMNSAIGFAKYQQYLTAHGASVDMQTVAIFVVIGSLGSLIGKSINARLNQRVLKRTFAIFLILLGGFIIANEGGKLASPLSGQSTSAPVDSGQTHAYWQKIES